MITRGPLNNAHNTREVTCEYTRVDTREDNYIVFYARETLHIYISTHLVCSEVNIFCEDTLNTRENNNKKMYFLKTSCGNFPVVAFKRNGK